jgi:DNA-binding XRE family transcriptional regulator
LTGGLGEAVHLLEAENADRAALLLRPRIVGPHADALERISEASNYSTYTLNPSRPLTSRPHPALGRAIRELRQSRGETQEELAPHRGISPKTLSLIERGEANPTWATVRNIASRWASQ